MTTQDRPTAAELLQVLGAFLEVMPAVSGPLQFRARVVANVAHILERGGRAAELEYDPLRLLRPADVAMP